jgi:hypothetical protein
LCDRCDIRGEGYSLANPPIPLSDAKLMTKGNPLEGL